MLIKNEIYEATVTDYTSEGQGVAHIDGCAVFLPNAIAGERCRVRIEVAKKTWAAGRIIEILEKSPTGSSGSAPCPPAAAAATSGTWTMKKRLG